MPDNSKYPGFDRVYRQAIDKGKSRPEAVRLACRAWLLHVGDTIGVEIDHRQREKLVTEGLKLYNEYRFDERDHKESFTAAQQHIWDGMVDHKEGTGQGSRSGGRSGGGRGGGLDDMSGLFDGLNGGSSHHGGSSSSRPHHGGSSSRPHHGSGSSSRHHHGSGSSSRPHHSSRPGPSYYPHHDDDSGSDEGWGGFFADGTPRPWWARRAKNQKDVDSDEEDRLFGPDTDKKFGRKPPKVAGNGGPRGGNSSSRRPSSPEGSDYFDSSSSSSRQPKPPRHHQSMGGSGGGPRGYNTREFRPSGSSSFSAPFGGDPFSQSSPFSGGGPGGMPDPFSFSSNFMGGGFGDAGSSSGPRRGYNTREFCPTPNFDFSSKFGGGGSSRRPQANYDSDDGMGGPHPQRHGHGHRPSGGRRRKSTDSHFDLSDDDDDDDDFPRGGHSKRRHHTCSSHSRPPPPPPAWDDGVRPPTCFYKVLDIPRTASDAEIKKAYRKMSLKYHPDRAAASGMDRERATRKMAEVNQANDVLSDGGKRAYYDATGCVKPLFG